MVLVIKLNYLVKTTAFSPAPEFDGRAGKFASYRQGVELWLLVTHLPLNRGAPALALAMDKMPRELCLSLGVAALHCDTGVETIMELLRKNLAPDAADAGFRDIIEFLDPVGPILRGISTCPALRWRVDGRRRDCQIMGFSLT